MAKANQKYRTGNLLNANGNIDEDTRISRQKLYDKRRKHIHFTQGDTGYIPGI